MSDRPLTIEELNLKVERYMFISMGVATVLALIILIVLVSVADFIAEWLRLTIIVVATLIAFVLLGLIIAASFGNWP